MMMKLLAALAVCALLPLTPMARADQPTPADCVDWWHKCEPGNDDHGTKPWGCFDVGGVLIAQLPCTPALPAGPAINQDGAAPAVFATDDPMCAHKYWYDICRNPDGSWMVCGLKGPGCQPIANVGPAPLPGSTPAPGINGSAYRTVPADVPGIQDLICSQLHLGYSPGQLAAILHSGGPQYSESQYLSTILNQEGNCP